MQEIETVHCKPISGIKNANYLNTYSFSCQAFPSCLGPQTKQYSGEVRLHSEDPGLWSCQDCRHQLHDDPLCGD